MTHSSVCRASRRNLLTAELIHSPRGTAEVLASVGLTEGEGGWQCNRDGGIEFWFQGYEQTRAIGALAAEAAATAPTPDRFADWLRGLDGFFALAVVGSGWAAAAVDRVRSSALLYARTEGKIVIDQSGPRLESRLGLGPDTVDPDGAAAIATAGFSIGTDTIYRCVRQLAPGQLLHVGPSGLNVTHYHRWQPWRAIEADPEELAGALAALHERLIEKLIASVDGRPILVPLSAGLDSRMILSGLVAAGYRNVRAFAYGLPGNRDAVVSREIARRLRVPWDFIPYSNGAVRRTMRSDAHRRYERYSDNLTGIYFPQDYHAMTQMAARGLAPPEYVVVNGQSGDFITGNHILAPLTQPGAGLTPEQRQARIIDTLVGKHFKQWGALSGSPAIARVRRRLAEEIAAVGGMPPDPGGDHGIYEFSEFVDRQSKYVIHGQRCYEFLGYGWRLPLWDRDCLDFWERAPLAAKRGQALYRMVLERANWGGVWRDVPVNPLRVRPGWLVPIRFGLKALHAPLGCACWHRFERRYLAYWMAPLCSFAPWSYRRVAADGRGSASALGWYAKDYLNRKGVGFDGQVIADGR